MQAIVHGHIHSRQLLALAGSTLVHRSVGSALPDARLPGSADGKTDERPGTVEGDQEQKPKQPAGEREEDGSAQQQPLQPTVPDGEQPRLPSSPDARQVQPSNGTTKEPFDRPAGMPSVAVTAGAVPAKSTALDEKRPKAGRPPLTSWIAAARAGGEVTLRSPPSSAERILSPGARGQHPLALAEAVLAARKAGQRRTSRQNARSAAASRRPPQWLRPPPPPREVFPGKTKAPAPPRLVVPRTARLRTLPPRPVVPGTTNQLRTRPQCAQ